MQIFSLNGEWNLAKANDTNLTYPAPVPGVVHQALLAADVIPDPFYRDQEVEQFWVGETDWLYTREFVINETLLAHDKVLLRCHGLDTLATIEINGTIIGRTDNMFRTYEIDVKEALQAGSNTIKVLFASPMNYLIEQESEHGILPTWSVGAHRINGGNYLRKEPCNFGWDWGPMLVTSGIWRDIELVGFDSARVADIHVIQDHQPNRVNLTVQLSIQQLRETPIQADISLKYADDIVAEQIIQIDESNFTVDLAIMNPHLWWIAGLGEQPLYDLEVVLTDQQGTVLDTQSKRIGLRTLELVRQPDKWGESFHFTINGVPFFTKGANWIPGDVYAPNLSHEKLNMLLQAAVDANMNMLRVWGGGLYESDEFYDLCDELGIAVWQDFIFACGTYPTYNAEFMANVRAEAEDNVRRIRHHASLALWCGNNEIEQGLVMDEWTDVSMSWEDYGKLFDVLLPEVVSQLDPQTDYWPGSPHSPCGERLFWANQTCGDTHLWDVWHKRAPFEWYRSRQDRFVSEFGFQSFPEPQTVYEFTEPGDRNLTSYVMEHHQRSGIGNSTIVHYMLDWFRLPTSFEANIWLSHILQGMAIKYAVEHWRRNMPRTMGTLYWQHNDLWPGPSWSSLDWHVNWKALHYMARDFYAPVLVSALEHSDTHTIDFHVTNDKLEAFAGTIKWYAVDFSGSLLEEGRIEAAVSANSTQLIETIDCADLVTEYGVRNLLIFVELEQDGVLISRNLVHFARPKHLELIEPDIQMSLVANSDGTTDLQLVSGKPALWVWFETDRTDIKWSDSFFHLAPHKPSTVRMTSESPISLADIRISSLWDTFA